MLSPAQIFELGKPKSGIAYVPIFETLSMLMGISTRYGNIVLNKGDGSADINYTPIKNNDYTISTNATFLFSYANKFTGSFSIKTLKGNKDVYSLYLGIYHDSNNNQSKFNITDIETFFKQFPNLYSVNINEYAYQETARMSVIKGDLAKFPDSVEKIRINELEVIGSYDGTLYLNLSNYNSSSKLKVFNGAIVRLNNKIKLIGDLANLPSSCIFFYLNNAYSTSSITYTAGKVWASAFNTLYLPIALTPTENDNLLIDAYNSITTAVGGKLFYLKGFRTSVSDFAVAGLIALGYTVNCERQRIILDLPFQNNFTDYSASGISMVAGNANGLPSFVSDGSGGYAVDFGGTKSIKTAVNLPINTSDKVTIVLRIKTSQTSTGMAAELSSNFDSNNAFGILLNYISTLNKIAISDHISAYNIGHSGATINTNNWFHIAITIDRSLGTAQNKIYVNKVLSYVQHATHNSNNNGNYGSFPLFLGQRGGSTLGFIGQMQYLQIYNYPLSAAEIEAL